MQISYQAGGRVARPSTVRVPLDKREGTLLFIHSAKSLVGPPAQEVLKGARL
jgi:hypothetical protein